MMTGIQYVIDEHGRKKSVIIDLKKYGSLWEDFQDQAVAIARKKEKSVSLAEVKRHLISIGKLPKNA